MPKKNVIQIVLDYIDKNPNKVKIATQNLDLMAQAGTRMGKQLMGAGLAVTGAFALIAKTSANTGDELAKTARRTGIAVETLSGLSFAAEQSGADLGALRIGIRSLARLSKDAADGLAEPQRAFKELGVEVKKENGELRSIEAILFDVSDKMSLMENATQKAALAQKILGRSGDLLLPMFENGSTGIKQLIAEAERLGIVWSTKDAYAAEEFNDALNRVTRSIGGAKREIFLAVQGPLTDIADKIALDIVPQVTEWISKNNALVVNMGKVGVAMLAGGGILYGLGQLSFALSNIIQVAPIVISYMQKIAAMRFAALGGSIGLLLAAVALLSQMDTSGPETNTPTGADVTGVGLGDLGAEAEKQRSSKSFADQTADMLKVFGAKETIKSAKPFEHGAGIKDIAASIARKKLDAAIAEIDAAFKDVLKQEIELPNLGPEGSKIPGANVMSPFYDYAATGHVGPLTKKERAPFEKDRATVAKDEVIPQFGAIQLAAFDTMENMMSATGTWADFTVGKALEVGNLFGGMFRSVLSGTKIQLKDLGNAFLDFFKELLAQLATAIAKFAILKLLTAAIGLPTGSSILAFMGVAPTATGASGGIAIPKYGSGGSAGIISAGSINSDSVLALLMKGEGILPEKITTKLRSMKASGTGPLRVNNIYPGIFMGSRSELREISRLIDMGDRLNNGGSVA